MCIGTACGFSICPFCTGAIGDIGHTAKLVGATISVSASGGLIYKYKMKIKKGFNRIFRRNQNDYEET